MSGSACRWCAEPLVEVDGHCRACGERAGPRRREPRWDGDLLVLPRGAEPPACCLRCGDRDARLHDAWTDGVGIRACGPCRDGEARRVWRRRAVWLAAVCAPLAVVVLMFAQEADRERLLGRVGVVGALLALAVAGRSAGRVRVVRRSADEVWLGLPDPAAVRAALPLRSP